MSNYTWRDRLRALCILVFITGCIWVALAIWATLCPAKGPTQPMLTLADQAGESIANEQGWQYVDRLANYKGDFRRARITLEFLAPAEVTVGSLSYKDDAEMEVEVLIERCAPGSYVVSTPLDEEYCDSDMRVMASRW